MPDRFAVLSIAEIVARVRIWLLGALTRFLAAPLDRCAKLAYGDLQELERLLRPGDVLLTAGNTRLSVLVKRFTRSTWTHVAMYVGPLDAGPDPRCIVEADVAEGVRAIRLSELDAKSIRVLRATVLSDTERRQLTESVICRIGSDYDVELAWMLGRRLLWRTKDAPPAVPPAMTRNATAFICSTLVVHAFAIAGYSIEAPQAPLHGGGHLTPADFEQAPLFTVAWSDKSGAEARL